MSSGAISLADLEQFLSPPRVPPQALEDLDPAYRAIYDRLDETVFSSPSRRHLLASSGAFEDRARRCNTGRLSVGFDSWAASMDHAPLYRQLDRQTALDIHLYLGFQPAPISGHLTGHNDTGTDRG